MAVNAELYLRSSVARLRAPAHEREQDRELASPFGLVTSPDGLPIRLSELTSEQTTQAVDGLATRAVAPPLSPTALWQNALPALERELGPELRGFRKRMLAARVPADYVSEMFAGRRSGAWAIYRDIRTVEGQGDIEFCLYVRRSKDQLAVWEGSGSPDSLRANFSRPIPGSPPAADDVRRGLAAALVRHRIAVPR
jgi:hypothetical protein